MRNGMLFVLLITKVRCAHSDIRLEMFIWVGDLTRFAELHLAEGYSLKDGHLETYRQSNIVIPTVKLSMRLTKVVDGDERDLNELREDYDVELESLLEWVGLVGLGSSR